jgi:hypothetical protein
MTLVTLHIDFHSYQNKSTSVLVFQRLIKHLQFFVLYLATKIVALCYVTTLRAYEYDVVYEKSLEL